MLDVSPVIRRLRPLVPLDGGRFATSDLNDLYRRVITHNASKRLQSSTRRRSSSGREAHAAGGGRRPLRQRRRGKTINGPQQTPASSRLPNAGQQGPSTCLALSMSGRLERAFVGARDVLPRRPLSKRASTPPAAALLFRMMNLRRVSSCNLLRRCAVDDAPVEVVERTSRSGRRRAARAAQVGRDHGDHVQHHLHSACCLIHEGVDDLEPLRELLRLASLVASRISARSCSESECTSCT